MYIMSLKRARIRKPFRHEYKKRRFQRPFNKIKHEVRDVLTPCTLQSELHHSHRCSKLCMYSRKFSSLALRVTRAKIGKYKM